MAKGNSKGRASSGGPRKSHGPKRKLFASYKPMVKSFADLGLLDKFNNYESFVQACNARGMRNPTREEFKSFFILPRDKQVEYFKKLHK